MVERKLVVKEAVVLADACQYCNNLFTKSVQLILELRAPVIVYVSVRRTQLMSSTYKKGNRHVTCLQEEVSLRTKWSMSGTLFQNNTNTNFYCPHDSSILLALKLVDKDTEVDISGMSSWSFFVFCAQINLYIGYRHVVRTLFHVFPAESSNNGIMIKSYNCSNTILT